jgi:hypothetical protein
LSVVGKTEDGKLVVSGIFELMSSILGVPLEFLMEEMKKYNMMVSWTHFYDSSVKHQWKYKTTRERVSSAVFEVYGPEYRDEVIKRLDKYHENKQLLGS